MDTTPRQKLAAFYQQRAARLRSIKLDDITASIPDGLWSPESESTGKVVTRLIEKYLSSFEEWWQNYLRDAEFALSTLQLRQRNLPQRFVYETELANARNRLTLAFINQYCTSDYEIDWRKIVAFNSGAS